MAGTALRIAGLADALAAVLPDVEARLAADGGMSDGDRRLLEALRWCATEAEEQNGLTVYALGLFRAKASRRRLREMRRDLKGLGVIAPTARRPVRIVTRIVLRAA